MNEVMGGRQIGSGLDWAHRLLSTFRLQLESTPLNLETDQRERASKMRVNRKQASTINDAITAWTQSRLIDDKTAESLRSSLDIKSFDWQRLAKYTLWFAIACIVIAVGSVLADEALLEALEVFFDSPPIVKAISLSILAGSLYYGGFYRRRIKPHKVFTNEALFFLGVLATAGAIYQLGVALLIVSGHFPALLLLSFAIYAALGFLLKSNLIWIFALLSFGSWMGAETGYASGWGAYYLGMNFPIRFFFLGAALTGTALLLERKSWFTFHFRSTLAVGLLYSFISLWLMSIFGNYGDRSSWYEARQIELLHWSLLFGLAAVAAIVHGLKFENGMTKGFGLTFLFINLYTRYFEFFWDSVHKAILFAGLAASFWFIGSRAEDIWRLGEKSKPK